MPILLRGERKMLQEGQLLAHYLVLCLNGCEEMRDRRCNGSDFGLDFVAPLLGESVFETLLIQPLATAFQVADVLSDGFIHACDFNLESSAY